jgi:Capsular polysaccharide biosynthesis protein
VNARVQKQKPAGVRRRSDAGFWRVTSLIWRHKWLIAAVFIVVVGGAVALSRRQQPLYEGSAQVVLSRQTIAAYLSGFTDVNSSQPASRYIDTQARLARTSEVATGTLNSAGLAGRSVDAFLSASSVQTDPNLDVLTFVVRDPDPAVARRLATSYAEEFVKSRQQLDLATISSARDLVLAELARLAKGGDTTSTIYRTFESKRQQLDVLMVLSPAKSDVVLTSPDAPRVQPNTLRNTAVAVVAALILGLGLALFADSLYVNK